MDRIFIVDLEVKSLIGVYPEERTSPQSLLINVVLSCDLRAAGQSDELADTIDYHQLECSIVALAEKSQVELLEVLAEQIASLALADIRVEEVVVRIDKPGALDASRAAAVEVVRKKR
jgi:dihydroneopterin aldolase